MTKEMVMIGVSQCAVKVGASKPLSIVAGEAGLLLIHVPYEVPPTLYLLPQTLEDQYKHL